MGTWTARQIWSALPRALRDAAAESLWDDPSLGRVERLEALAPWLAVRGLRARFLEQMPRSRRAVLLASGGLPEETASQLLISFHLVRRRSLLARFLDQLGIAHDDGLIDAGAEIDAPSLEAIRAAADALREREPAADVELYLRTLTATDPFTWAAVAELVEDPP